MGNFNKTLNYFKRNGFKSTYIAVTEKLFSKDKPYNTEHGPVKFDGELDENVKFSILVPVFETKEQHLREMIESVLSQVYSNFELILADASKSDNPKNIIASYKDDRIKYVPVKENKSISDNTNAAIDAATGNYCGLLDHDDLLTPDALYEMAMAVSKSKAEGLIPKMIYSGEDKTDGDGINFFDEHIKQKLNLDLFLSNNYICHFTVIDTELIKKLRFRPEYNGSQDYDMFLRVVLNTKPEEILFLNEVLYHWRCHEESTAFNPASKEYAYEAGKRAIADFVKNKWGTKLPVTELSHKGFYRVEWGEDIFKIRPEVGAVGGPIYTNNKITSGFFREGPEELLGLKSGYTGYMHRATLTQDVFCTDIRNVKVRDELLTDYNELVNYLNVYCKNTSHSEAEIDGYAKKLSKVLGKRVKEKGYLFLYMPTNS